MAAPPHLSLDRRHAVRGPASAEGAPCPVSRPTATTTPCRTPSTPCRTCPWLCRPQFWYCWQLVMPVLAEHFTVIAADHRGQGAGDKPATGYDMATLADDLAGLMTGLGHSRYAAAGIDVGMVSGYALAASHRERVTRLAVVEAILPGISPLPNLLADPATNEFLWHVAFNRLRDINERMVVGRGEIYFGHQFATKAASTDAVPPHAVDAYVEALRDPAALPARASNK
ncbi:alpha/beta fold hydrolase [Streptomyces canus]|uniref:alpha/beta fold hydrolase n=1 Tax=Streptomyces canus TaxID=58343 RepID=UPI003819433E